MNFNVISLVLLRLAISYIWLTAGISKLLNPGFINSFSQTLSGFAKGTHFSFYSEYLNHYIMPHALLFAQLTIWGEILTGVAFLLGFPLSIACIAGITMNLNYFFVATQTPSQFLNIILIFSQIAAYTNGAGKSWGLEAKFVKK